MVSAWVLMGERYKMATKETKAVLRGEYGQTIKPMNQEVIDKVIPGEERITCRYADMIDTACVPTIWEEGVTRGGSPRSLRTSGISLSTS